MNCDDGFSIYLRFKDEPKDEDFNLVAEKKVFGKLGSYYTLDLSLLGRAHYICFHYTRKSICVYFTNIGPGKCIINILGQVFLEGTIRYDYSSC